MKIRAYILAGGKSSRMGRDKAMLELAGMTLLARAVVMLRSVSRLQGDTGEMIVTIAGKREALEGADRSITDRYPECGPLGGIEGALDDLEHGGGADWALFIPVDMPLLRAELVDNLLVRWVRMIRSDSFVRACLVEVDGRLQPLVSLIHRTVLGEIRAALDTGSYKVLPVLKSAGLCCTSLGQEETDEHGRRDETWPEIELATMETCLQFTNVNTEADLIEVATLIQRSG